ncbi:MAG: hypothetical protein ACLPWF_13515 [Bryobacteraceae bacterium]
MENAIEQINGCALVSGEISPSTGDSRLEFTDKIVLKTFVLTSEEDARWNLKHGQNDAALLGPNLVPSETDDPPADSDPQP